MGICNIFIVEDDPWYGEILEYNLSLNPNYHVTRFTSGKDCLDALHKNPDLITVDYALPDINGTTLLKQIKTTCPDMPVIVISGQKDISTAVELLKQGATDYLVKNDNTKDLLWNAILRIRENQRLKKEVESLRQELGIRYDFEKVIKGNSPALKTVFGLMEKAAKTNINVSITGETGTGKELVAKAIHYNSARKAKPFVALNMAAIPAELLESELFGYEKGAFTGATARKTGKFEKANKGTLFLDEIGELDQALQSKLLRVLQERELTRLGGHEKIKLDVRLIVATHKNLSEQVKKGDFREDFYYRIMGMPITLPPLRARGNDIIILAKLFLDNFCKENKLPLKSLSTGAKNKLLNYSFPGNVRELKAIMDLAAVMCDEREIGDEHISYSILEDNDFLIGGDQTLKDYNIRIITHYLKKYNNNIVRVAEKLAIGKSTIYKMIHDKEINLAQ